MTTTVETLPAAPVQANTRSRQFPSRLCRAGASLIVAMVAMQTAAVGEPLSSTPIGVSAVAPGATTGSAGAPAAARREPSAVGGNGPQESAAGVHLRFFGFLEFDWDSPGSGGVPGFGPLPDSP